MNIKSLVVAGVVITIGIVSMAMMSIGIDVPEAVKQAFAQKFPAAQQVEWEMENAHEYEAEFELNSKKMSANFMEDGTWVGAETEMELDDLPQAVKDGIEAGFPGFEVEEVELSEKPNGLIAYEIELENEKEDIELKAVFSSDGKLIKKEMNEKEEEDDDDDGR